MSHPSLVAGAAAAALLAASGAAAQEVKKVEKVIVTASPLGRADTELAQPATVLTEEELRRKRAASIGDTLSQELGVQSSAFGPAAGRPIIRGLDGPRIRVLENGIGTMDVSTLSPDHAVTTESLGAEQVEILRGPASLLYGSGAIGGIVNVVSNLIPRERPAALEGAVEGRFSSADRERTGSFKLGGGAADIAWRLTGFTRTTDDYRIPGHAVRDDPESATGKLPGSDIDARGAGAGASWIGSRGHWGASVQGLRNEYGVPSGEGTRVDLRQNRYETAGELSDPLSNFTRLKFRAAFNDYQHEEIEPTGEVATTFKNRASEARLELAHGAIAGLKGTLGAQFQDREASALGEEAILPKTRSRAAGVFVVEEMEWGTLKLDAGVRFERETRRPDADLASRNFSLVTPALGLVWSFAPDYRLSVSATQAQRAPAIEELYTFGPHHATETFEIGNPALGKEVSRNVDFTLRKAAGDSRWRVNLFVNRIRDYIFAASVDADGDGAADRVDGEMTLDPEGEFLLQRFSFADARFHGVEAEWTYRPVGGPGGVRIFGDMVRGRLAGGENLPRMSPARVGVELDARFAAWTSHLTVVHAFEQKKLAPLETPTPGYTRVDAEVAYQVSTQWARTLTVFLQGRNLLDREIRAHTSYLKDLVPQMGRSFTLGVRADF